VAQDFSFDFRASAIFDNDGGDVSREKGSPEIHLWIVRDFKTSFQFSGSS
jgi:hypothetical protein